MKLIEKIKIMLMIKRFTDRELFVIKEMIDKEFNSRNKNLLRHK